MHYSRNSDSPSPSLLKPPFGTIVTTSDSPNPSLLKPPFGTIVLPVTAPALLY